MVMSDRWRMPSGLRRASAVVAVVALVVGGAKVAGDHMTPGCGFSTMQTAAADPTGPTGGPGSGPGGMNGSQFQPPGLPPQQPDYQGGINQPPLDQNSGISIYNSGNPQASQQVPGQQGGQQPQQGWDQPAHGTQIPDYQTNPGYTQGPGKPNPDYQAPQQQSPQQGQQPQQQGQQQPSQAPTQTEQPSSPAPTQAPTQTQEPSDQQNQQNDQRSSENGKDNTDEQCKQAEADVAAGKPLSQPELFRNDLGLLGSMNRSIDGNSLNYAVDDSAPLDVVQKAANQWNYAKGSKVFLTRVKGDPDVIVKFGDFGETDWVGNWSKSLFGPDVISINKWFFKPNKYYPAGLSDDGILATVTHELGHALGLGHSCSGLVMHATADSGQAVSPQPVDIAAVNYGR